MSDHVFFNGGPDSVVIDTQGHILDAQYRITGNPRGAVISRLVASGQLVDLGPVEGQSTEDNPEPEPEQGGKK